MQQPKMKILLSGGGTGGHIYPAIAIAEAFEELVPGAEVHFVGAEGRMEMEKIPAAGYPITGIGIVGIQRGSLLKNLGLPFKVLRSLRQARQIIRRHRPSVCVGTGGYASWPLLFQAQLMGIPTYVQEQNALAGLANKLLGKRAKAVFTAWPGMGKYFPKTKVVETGNPLRNFSLNIGRPEALKRFGLEEGRKTLLALGGSLGAKTINQAVEAMLPALPGLGINLLWQTGKGGFDAEKAQKLKEKYPFAVQLPFIDDMAAAYAVADLAISRAGAISLAELAVAGIPAIIVPSPNVTDDHQTHNAGSLADAGAAVLIKDTEAKAQLQAAVEKLLAHPQQLAAMSEKVRRFGNPNAAKQIVQYIINDMGGHK